MSAHVEATEPAHYCLDLLPRIRSPGKSFTPTWAASRLTLVVLRERMWAGCYRHASAVPSSLTNIASSDARSSASSTSTMRRCIPWR